MPMPMPMPIRRLVYEDRNDTLCGRTLCSWGSFIIFCIILSFMLFLMFVVGLIGFATFSILNSEPKWKSVVESSIGAIPPGLDFQPLSLDTERGSVIKFDRKNPAEVGYWTELMDNFLAPYNVTPRSENQRVCSFDQDTSTNAAAAAATPMPVCLVDIGKFANACSPATGYGYTSGRPCVFLQLERMYGWVPQVYDNLTELPEDMPADLIEYIVNVPATKRQQVWVSCTGQQQQKHPVNNVTYVGSRGFPSYYYPYMNQPGYLSPLVAVQFERINASQLVGIECRAWAKNIYRGNKILGRQGSVSWEFSME